MPVALLETTTARNLGRSSHDERCTGSVVDGLLSPEVITKKQSSPPQEATTVLRLR